MDWAQQEALVGKRWAFFVPRFTRFAQGGWFSWNWAAFFATHAWLRYRRMYAWSWAYLPVSVPVLLSAYLVWTGTADSCGNALEPDSPLIAPVVVALLFVQWVLFPLIANRLYFNHTQRLADNPGAKPGTGGWRATVVFQLLLVFGAFNLAAMWGGSIYRARAGEAITIMSSPKAMVETWVQVNEELPDPDVLAQEFGPSQGQYVERVVFQPGGIIQAEFGETAGALSGHFIFMVPRMEAERVVGWTCGSSLPDVCLPSSCGR